MPAQGADPLGVTGLVLDGKFTVEKAIGEGGAAVVYRGMHTAAGAPVAIKFLIALTHTPDADRKAVIDEFIREGNLVAELSTRSSAIVQARDIGILERQGEAPLPYLVLEWLDGRTLDEVLVAETNSGKAPRSLTEAVKYIEPVAGALAIAHERGVVHRDVKPENIFVVERGVEGPGARIKLLDFGIAKVMRKRMSGIQQTGTLPTAFTPHYGAPEQFSRTYGETGAWSDVFAMALVILEVMRGGRRAFSGDDYIELARQSCDEGKRPTPRTIGLAVSDMVESVFSRALAVQPMHRYGSMGEFWAALTGALDPAKSGNYALMGPSAGAAAAVALVASRQSAAPGPITSGAPIKPTGNSAKKIVVVAAIGGVLIIGAAAVVAAKKLASGDAKASASSTPPTASVVPSGTASVTIVPVPVSGAPVGAVCPEGAVAVAGGGFGMGSRSDEADGPRHTVYLDAFCLDKTEVTVAQYEACSSAGTCSKPADSKPACTFGKGEPGKPVNCVTFDQATTLCGFRGMRLPTEAEWERAASNAMTGMPWSTAGAIDTRANLSAETDGFSGIAPVGSFPNGNSDAGIADLIGNVAEWQNDWFGPYPTEEAMNPTGPSSGKMRVVRGGAYSGFVVMPDAKEKKIEPKPTHREAMDPSTWSESVGFRCAKSLKR